MKAGLLWLPILVALGIALVMSGDAAPSREKGAKGRRRPQGQIEVLGETADHRWIKHPMGETEVPLHPQRIASLCKVATDSLVALGVRPVLIESAWMSDGPPSYLAHGLAGTAVLRRTGQLSVEAVLDVRPDLIITGSAEDGGFYAQLSKIAPTVVLNNAMLDSRQSMLVDVGDIVGLSKLARQRLAEYRRKLDGTKSTIAAESWSQPVAFLRFRQRTCVIYSQTAMFGPLLFDEIGLKPDPAMPRTMRPGGWDVLSVERLATLKAEHIFMLTDRDSELYFQYVAGTPVWRRIPAVQKHQVHRVEATTWIGGEGVLANEAILRDVLAAMGEQEIQ